MQKREKILAGILGAAVLFWFGMPILNSVFIAPVNELEIQRDQALQDANNKVQQQLALAKRGKTLTVWRRTSLPPSENDAARLYQEWLTEIAQMSGFSDAEFIIGQRRKVSDTFYEVPVTINAKATLQELAQFLERFESVDLLHRIKACEVKSPRSEGNPDLTVMITAEGVSIQSAPPRAELFPEVEIANALDKDTTTVTLSGDISDFPKAAPFRVRISDEFINVTEIDGNRWTLQRGVAQTFADNHAERATIELFPLTPEPDATQEQVQNLWSKSLFTKPAPFVEYNPRLARETIPPAIRDRTYSFKFDVASWNPAHGDPRFTLLQHPEGMDIDERTGQITWPVSATAEIGERPLEVVVWGTASKDAGFTKSLNLRVRDPNVPPTLENDGPVRFFLGRQSQVRLRGVDPDGDSSRLTYRLDNAQPGMTIGANDGIIRWTPPEAMDAQSTVMRVTVTDSDELPASTTINLPVAVEEDSARFAYLTGSLELTRSDDDVKWKAWIFDRATNRNTTIAEGEKFTIADFEMTVAEIGPDFVKLRRDSGLYELKFGQPLVAMVKLNEPNQDYSPEPDTANSADGNEATGTSDANTESSSPPTPKELDSESPTPSVDSERLQSTPTEPAASQRSTVQPTDEEPAPATAANSQPSPK